MTDVRVSLFDETYDTKLKLEDRTRIDHDEYVPGQGSQASEFQPLDAHKLVSGFTVLRLGPLVTDAQLEVPTKSTDSEWPRHRTSNTQPEDSEDEELSSITGGSDLSSLYSVPAVAMVCLVITASYLIQHTHRFYFHFVLVLLEIVGNHYRQCIPDIDDL